MTTCLVVYDIPETSLRTRISETCLDYGLERIQYSAFLGELNRNLQEELLQKLRRHVGKKEANVQLFPICEKDLELRKVIINGPK